MYQYLLTHLSFDFLWYHLCLRVYDVKNNIMTDLERLFRVGSAQHKNDDALITIRFPWGQHYTPKMTLILNNQTL